MKKTRRALLCSFVAMILCLSMLVGTTFAWFTDEVTSAGNIIKAGTLDIDLMHKSDVAYAENGWVSIEDNLTHKVFDYDLWEPGYTQVETLKVVNNGNLALKFKLTTTIDLGTVDVGPNDAKLADVIDVYITEGEYDITGGNRVDLANWKHCGTLAELMADEDGLAYGVLLPAGTTAAENDKNEPVGEIVVSVALKMQESAGNDYKNLSAGDIYLNLSATQYTYEEDSFDDQYDKDSKYPLINGVTLDAQNDVTVNIPEGAPEGEYALNVGNVDVSEDANGITTLSLDIELLMDGDPVEDGFATYEVSIELAPMLDVQKVYHNGEEIKDFQYDVFTGILTFETDSFSPFEIKYEIIGEGFTIDEEKRTIHGGLFKVDPVTLDASLDDEGSIYMITPYTKGGEPWYAVSEEDTTVIIKPEDSGKIWSIISGLQNNEHSTVYIMPGTYNEGTTIYVYSSMDIIGLGDAEDIKIVKTSSSSSNRHLFNCNGTKADYIEVTIRNMTLDATAKTTNSKDNAAVQCIRKSKVKCYDLDIIKGTDWDAVAFYVNGNNAVDGVKYPVYMYVENCTLNTTRSFGVVTTSGSYKFYHTGLTYGGNEYTNNSGSIKNVVLEWNDWDW